MKVKVNLVKSGSLLRLGNKGLQYFADGDGGETSSADNPETNSNTENPEGNESLEEKETVETKEGKETSDNNSEGKENKESAEELLPQSQVNGLVKKKQKEAEEKLFKKLGVKDFKSAQDALQKFQKMQEDQLTDQQKIEKKANDLEKSYNEAQDTIQTLNAKIATLQNDVNPDSVDDVITLAKPLVNEDTDMNEAVKQIVKKYPQFKKQQKEEKKTKKPKFTNGEHKGEDKQTEEEKWASAFNFFGTNNK